jgi:hypothetical protein
MSANSGVFLSNSQLQLPNHRLIFFFLKRPIPFFDLAPPIFINAPQGWFIYGLVLLNFLEPPP